MAGIKGIVVCLAIMATVANAAVETVNGDLSVETVERSIDIASQLVKITTKLTLSNGGKGAVSGFHYGVEESAKDHISYIGATVSLSISFFDFIESTSSFSI